MIKTILVPATGSDTDSGVFASALAVARPFGARIDFLHVRIDAATFAATIMPEVSSAQVVTDLINRMEEEAERREEKAKQLFEGFCQREGLALAETPPGPSAPSARWLRKIGSESYWLLEYARAADLLIIGRPSDDQIAPSDVLESALLNSGRPLLIPPSARMAALPDTVIIAWKATPEAARAVTAAMPFLSIAKQIVIMTVAEDETTLEEEGAARLMANFRWHGFAASVRRLEPGAQGPAETLLAAAREQAALLVMGGYGGGDSDQAVSATALGVAQPLGAHLEFLHIQVDPGEAALSQPHAEFARGPAMREILERLETECVMRTAVARDNFAQFCELRGISITDRPKPDSGVSPQAGARKWARQIVA